MTTTTTTMMMMMIQGIQNKAHLKQTAIENLKRKDNTEIDGQSFHAVRTSTLSHRSWRRVGRGRHVLRDKRDVETRGVTIHKLKKKQLCNQSSFELSLKPMIFPVSQGGRGDAIEYIEDSNLNSISNRGNCLRIATDLLIQLPPHEVNHGDHGEGA